VCADVQVNDKIVVYCDYELHGYSYDGGDLIANGDSSFHKNVIVANHMVN
jgi:hypothetical protein